LDAFARKGKGEETKRVLLSSCLLKVTSKLPEKGLVRIDGKSYGINNCTLTAESRNMDKYLKRFKGKVVLIDNKGNSQLVSWTVLVQYVGIDIARLLSKGVNFRINTDRKPVAGDKFMKQLIEVKKCKLGKGGLNFCPQWTFRTIFRILREAGLLVRKEDRGKHLCIVEEAWEAKQYKYGKLRFNRAKEDIDSGYLYYQPKTHKEGLVVGRPVIALKRNKLDVFKYARKLLESKLKCDKPILSCTSTKDAINKLEVSNSLLTVVTGDIESMFPSIDVNEVERRLLEQFGSNYVNAFRLFNNRTCKFGKFFCKQKKGLLIGSEMSPLIANWFLNELEKNASMTLKGSRYVDDVALLVGKDAQEEIKKSYEDAILPGGLKMEWEAKSKFLDVEFLQRH
jgi:hypothetical protein